jgi:hypothetical protein
MVISAIGRIAAKAAIKKISNASAKKARAAVKADLKRIDSKAIEAMKTAEGTGRASGVLKNFKLPIKLPTAAGEPGVLKNFKLPIKLPTAAGEPGKFGPLLSQKVKRKVQNALDRFKKPSRQKGGGMATRGMGAALRGGGMALRGMGAAYKKK